MAKLYGIYKCEVCGNIVEVLHAGDGEPVCCGKPMKFVTENTSDGAKEKHVPSYRKDSERLQGLRWFCCSPNDRFPLHRVDRTHCGWKEL